MSHLEQGADGDQRLQGAAVLARPPAARGRQQLHAQARHARGAGHGRGDRAGHRHLGPLDSSPPSGSSATGPARSCCAPSASWRSTSTGRTRPPAASSWSRTICRSAAASSRWRATRTSAAWSPSARPTSPPSATPSPARRARSGTATRAACSGSPASRAPASRPWRWRSSASCSPRATRLRARRRQHPHRLNANLGFSPDDRAENIRRVGEVAALFADAGFLVISSFISPYRSDRERARAAAGESSTRSTSRPRSRPARARDPKGLYRRARAGEIPEFTGISSPYEPPEFPISRSRPTSCRSRTAWRC